MELLAGETLAARIARGPMPIEDAEPIAAGIAGSLLSTPYLGFQDFLMLIVAGWLVLRSGATAWQVGLMVVGYALLQLALFVLAFPIILAEALFLLLMLWSPRPAPRASV